MRFKRAKIGQLLCCLLSVVALGIELSTTRLSAEYGQPALDYLVKVGHLGVEPRVSCSQSRRASICTCTRSISDPDHLTAVPGSRTQPPRIERPMTSPEVERAVLSTFAERKVGREALESSSAALQTAAIPSQLPAQVVSIWTRKNPMPFLRHRVWLSPWFRPSVTSANVARAAYSPVGWRNYLCLFVRI